MKKYTAKQMQQIDLLAQTEYHIPGIVLMENAGLRSADIIAGLLKRCKQKTVFIFCGPGNNGGDGFVTARHLINRNIKVRVFLLVSKERLKGDSLINYEILKAMKAQIIEFAKIPYLKDPGKAFDKAGLIVDAILGTGLSKEVGGIFSEIIDLINQTKVPVVSLDIPSGLCATTGKIFTTAVKASYTLTFGGAKKGFFLKETSRYIGKLKVLDISIPKALLK